MQYTSACLHYIYVTICLVFSSPKFEFVLKTFICDYSLVEIRCTYQRAKLCGMKNIVKAEYVYQDTFLYPSIRD